MTPQIIPIPFELAVEVLGAGDSIVFIDRRDSGLWLIQDRLDALTEYRLTKDSAGLTVVLMPTLEAGR